MWQRVDHIVGHDHHRTANRSRRQRPPRVEQLDLRWRLAPTAVTSVMIENAFSLFFSTAAVLPVPKVGESRGEQRCEGGKVPPTLQEIDILV